ncbi:hypothetical protein TWF696_000706 [Orbilia brochopaga]|uniref:Uncharacterized protein n=1 Tax=Orbilia brochopaga TaxID=3140254 RepID=A0AAV9VEQ8_9PEZI
MPRVTRSQTATLRQQAAAGEEAPQQQRKPFVEVDMNIAVEPTKPARKPRATRSRAKKTQKEEIQNEELQKENSDPAPEIQCESPITEQPSGPAKVTVAIGEVEIAIEVAHPARTRVTRQAVASGKVTIEPVPTSSEQSTSVTAKRKPTSRVTATASNPPPAEPVNEPTPTITTTKKNAPKRPAQEVQPSQKPLAPAAEPRETRRSTAVTSSSNNKAPIVTTTRTARLRAENTTGKSIDAPPKRASIKSVSETTSSAPAAVIPSQPTQTVPLPKTTAPANTQKPATTSRKPIGRGEGTTKLTLVGKRTDITATETASALHQPPQQPSHQRPDPPKATAPKLAPSSRIHALAAPKALPALKQPDTIAAIHRPSDPVKPQSIRHALDIYESPRKPAPAAASLSPRKEPIQDIRPRPAATTVESPMQRLSTPKRLPTGLAGPDRTKLPTMISSPGRQSIQATVARFQAGISAATETTSPGYTPQQRQIAIGQLSPHKREAQTPTSRHTITSTASPFSRLATPRRPATGVSISPVKETTPSAKPPHKPIAAPSPLLKQTPKRPSYLPSPVKSNKPVTTPIPFRFNAMSRTDTAKDTAKPAIPVQPVTPQQRTVARKPWEPVPVPRPSAITPRTTVPTPKQAPITPKIATPTHRQSTTTTPRLAAPAQRKSAIPQLSSPALLQSKHAPKQYTGKPSAVTPTMKDRIKNFESPKRPPQPAFTDARTLLREARKEARKGTLPELKGEVGYATLPTVEDEVPAQPEAKAEVPAQPEAKPAPSPDRKHIDWTRTLEPASAAFLKGLVLRPPGTEPPRPPSPRTPIPPSMFQLIEAYKDDPKWAGHFYVDEKLFATVPPAWTVEEIEREEKRQAELGKKPRIPCKNEQYAEQLVLIQTLARRSLDEVTEEDIKRANARAEAVKRGHKAVMDWAMRPSPASLLPYGCPLPTKR